MWSSFPWSTWICTGALRGLWLKQSKRVCRQCFQIHIDKTHTHTSEVKGSSTLKRSRWVGRILAYSTHDSFCWIKKNKKTREDLNLYFNWAVNTKEECEFRNVQIWFTVYKYEVMKLMVKGSPPKYIGVLSLELSRHARVNIIWLVLQMKSPEWLRKTLNAIGFLCCVEWQEIKLNDSAWLS